MKTEICYKNYIADKKKYIQKLFPTEIITSKVYIEENSQ